MPKGAGQEEREIPDSAKSPKARDAREREIPDSENCQAQRR
jgi:hypothetical protein